MRWRKHDAPVAQALLTFYDTEQRRRWLNARATMETLLERGAIPIVNENDTVATEEIRYGDNDRLAARVAQMLGADVLVLLSDIDGLYDADPRSNPDAKHIAEVRKLTPEIVAMAGGVNAAAGVGSGGMATKLDAARIAMTAGCSTLITLGTNATTDGRADRRGGGRREGHMVPRGRVARDGAQAMAGGRAAADGLGACRCGRGAGAEGGQVAACGWRHSRGGTVRARRCGGRDRSRWRAVARGVSAYSSEDAVRLLGRKSDAFEAILGYRGRPALIHVDDMVLVG